ncbi:MAG: hypothetical protein JW727_06975 [Candidatus Aenigmarchaeota archaeon]|nr:hypothetical protein [Candidatus Aenigmarchaeota archaeon]
MGSKDSRESRASSSAKDKYEIPDSEIGGGSDIKSLQYEIFQDEEKMNTLPKSLYERAANFSEKILPLDPDKKAKEKLQEAIEFAHISVTPRGVLSVTFLLGALLFFAGGLLVVMGFFTLAMAVIYFCVVAGLSYYLYTYPFRLKKIYELRVGSEIVMMVLHMVIFMRNYPNLEGAVKFSASNITGPLALDLKKLMWDVHIGTYDSMEQGILAFSQKWKTTFRSFSDSINSIVYSLYTSGNRRIELLDESVKIILDSLDERSNSYVTQLKSPITLVNALGILLPILVLTMLPIITIFLENIPPEVIFGLYDILLPMTLLFVIKNILDQRVVTLPEPDLSLNPNIPPQNMFSFKGINIRSLIPALLILLPFAYLACTHYEYMVIASEEDINKYFTAQERAAMGATGLSGGAIIDQGLYLSYFIVLGLFLSISSYFLLNSFQKIKFRKEILEMEDEFREVLFGLGQEIDRGIPIEVALQKIAPTLRGQFSVKLIDKVMQNINYRGMTFERAIFDENEGAIRYFPSKLIRSVLKAVTDSSKKGTKISAEIMISISKYLSDIHRTQENIQDKFSEILGGMSMQAKILLPLICAIMSVITYMIVQMMNFLSYQIGALSANQAVSGYAGLLTLFKKVEMSPAMFQFAVGIYAIETIIILSWFMNGILRGTDKISLHNSIGKNLLVGGLLYILIAVISVMIFSPFLEILKVGLGTAI